jgi:hypothetical protein
MFPAHTHRNERKSDDNRSRRCACFYRKGCRHGGIVRVRARVPRLGTPHTPRNEKVKSMTTEPRKPALRLADQYANLGSLSTVTGDRYKQVVNALDIAHSMLTHFVPKEEQEGNSTLAYFRDLVLACQGMPPEGK